jgi:hypothetical protein
VGEQNELNRSHYLNGQHQAGPGFFFSKDSSMANINTHLDELMTCEGALCAMVLDSNNGMVLGRTGVDMELAAAGHTEVVRAKMKTMRTLGLDDALDDIFITLGKHHHIIRPLTRNDGVFIHLVLDKNKANLVVARRKTAIVEKNITV